ncbi:MAG: ArsA-related P-loop ATPase [Thermoanaerobaculales bacterium]|nr:ArsA-related P-loop ATPase [Thermoanaerobaculales bacterium]
MKAPLTVVVGSGGVGKTTLAAAMAADEARRGNDTLVMTFDPSLRLKDALGVDREPEANEIRVPFDADGELWASLLDARRTFDTLIDRHAPDAEARQRILTNRFYDHLSGSLAGVLEYMASERLFEVADYGRYDRVILDTPPTRQALDFLGAPERIVAFLESGALRIALKPWFDADGSFKATAKLGVIGRNVESFFDRMVGMELLRDMAEFFQAFAPLFDGFRERALEVQRMLRSAQTRFILVSGPGEQRVADTLFFARKLSEEGYRLGPVIVNRVHPEVRGADGAEASDDGRGLLAWLGEKDSEGVERLRELLGGSHPLAEVPLRPDEPTDLAALAELGATIRFEL